MNEWRQLIERRRIFEVSVPSHFISLYDCSASVVSWFFMFHKRNNEIHPKMFVLKRLLLYRSCKVQWGKCKGKVTKIGIIQWNYIFA